LPGNGVAQVRRVIAHTRNYVDLMPISAVWAGEKKNPSSLMPPDSPPLLYAATQGGVPYRLNLHDYDVGHTLLIGPTGAGKSVSLALFVAQWFRYPNAQVFAFDKGHSLYGLCKAAGGRFYDVGEGGLSFQPLRDIDDDAEFGWGQEWVETVLRMQKVEIGPGERNTIHRALQQLASAPRERRTLADGDHAGNADERRSHRDECSETPVVLALDLVAEPLVPLLTGANIRCLGYSCFCH